MYMVRILTLALTGFVLAACSGQTDGSDAVTEDVVATESTETDADLTSISPLFEVVQNCNEDCALVFAAQDEMTRNLPEDFEAFMTGLGSTVADLAYRDSYVGLVSNGALVEEVSGPIEITETFSVFGNEISVFSGGLNASRTQASIMMDGNEMASGKRGVSVLEVRANGEVQAHWFDTFKSNGISGE